MQPGQYNEYLLAHEKIKLLEKIDSVLKQMRPEKERLEEKVSALKLSLAKENFDVYKIEGKSLSKLYYGILGKLEERTEKERSEASAASFMLQQALEDLNDLEEQIKDLESERTAYLSCKESIESFIEERKEQLLDSSGEAASKLIELENRLNAAKVQLKEIEEAKLAGRNVVAYINNELSKQKPAKDFGEAAMPMGFGRAGAPFIKSNAAINNEKVQRLLQRFNAELKGINIIADWRVKERIGHSHISVLKTRNQVSEIIKKLEQLKHKQVKQIKRLEEEIAGTVAYV